MVRFIVQSDTHNLRGKWRAIRGYCEKRGVKAILDAGDASDFQHGERGETDFDHHRILEQIAQIHQAAQERKIPGEQADLAIRDTISRFKRYAFKEGEEQARELAGWGGTLLYRPGNHDSLPFLEGMKKAGWKNIKVLDEQPTSLEGLTILGGTSYYESGGLQTADPTLYNKPEPRSFFGKENGNGKKGKDLSRHPFVEAYARTRPVTISLNHKGIGPHAIAPGDSSGWHKGLEEAVKRAGVRLSFSGHSHTAAIKMTERGLDLVASPDISFDVRVSENGEVESVTVLEYVYPKRPYQVEMFSLN